MKKLSWVVLMVVLIVACSSWPLPQAQDIPTCVNELNPCGPFINSTTAKPPATCCNPLKQLLKDDLPCICDAFANLALVAALSLNVSEAITLPKRCDMEFDLVSECDALLSSAKAPAPASHKHPHPQSPASGPGEGNAAIKISSVGSVLGLLLLLTTLLML